MKPIQIDDDIHKRFVEFCKRNPDGKLSIGDTASKILDKVVKGLMIDISGLDANRRESVITLVNVSARNFPSIRKPKFDTEVIE